MVVVRCEVHHDVTPKWLALLVGPRRHFLGLPTCRCGIRKVRGSADGLMTLSRCKIGAPQRALRHLIQSSVSTRPFVDKGRSMRQGRSAFAPITIALTKTYVIQPVNSGGVNVNGAVFMFHLLPLSTEVHGTAGCPGVCFKMIQLSHRHAITKSSPITEVAAPKLTKNDIGCVIH